jgi:hypothetical protein
MRTTRVNATGLRAPTPRGPDGRRGAALMLALIVLAALFLLALPFAVFMRMQHGSGTQSLHTARARAGSQGALSHAKAVLSWGIESRERTDPIFPFDNPDVDTPWEFHVTLRTRTTEQVGDAGANRTFEVANAVGFPTDGDPGTVDGYIRVDTEWMAYSDITPHTPNPPQVNRTLRVRSEDRGLFGTAAVTHNVDAIVSFYPEYELWDLDVQDQQALINVNTAPYDVILNLLGYLRIGGDSPDDGATFPSARQQALARAISNYRVYYSIWENDDGTDDIPDGTYTPFQNLNMLKDIAVAPYFTGGILPLSAEEFDKLRRYLTVHSEFTGTSRWGSTASLDGDISASPPGNTPATDQSMANLDDAEGIGVGTLVRITETGSGRQPEYRIVASRNQDARLQGAVAAGTDRVPIRDAGGFHQMSASTFSYIYINDGASSEWIRYTGVDRSVTPPELTGVQGDWWGTPGGTSGVRYDHGNGTRLDGCVVTWEYDLAGTYTQADAEVTAESRHAININTVDSPIILRSILLGIDDGTTSIPADKAAAVADEFLAYTSGEAVGTTPSWFDGNENWFDGVNYANLQTEWRDFFVGLAGDGTITTAQADLLRNNFSTDPGNWPGVSTVPVRFNSGTMIGIDTQGGVDDRAGTPIAQVPLKAGLTVGRVYDVVPPLSPLFWVLRSQSDFYNHMTSSLLSSRVFTNPLNMGIDPATFDAATVARYEDISDGIGTVTPVLCELHRSLDYTTMEEGLHESPGGPPSFDLDYSISADTAMVKTGVTAGVDNTTSEGIKDVQLQYNTDYGSAPGERHIEADSLDATMQPFAVEFWMRPGDDVTTRQLLVDLGDDADPDSLSATSQVRVYLENGRLNLRIDDPISDQAGTGYEGYVLAQSTTGPNGFAFDAGTWHHVAIAAVGTFRNEIAMFIDGIYDRQMTWTYNYEGGTADPSAVQEGSFLPVAMPYPDRTTAVTWGPGLAGEWPIGSNQIGVEDRSWLPQRGAVVIGDSEHPYAYDGFGTAVVQDPPGSGNPRTVDTLRLVGFATGNPTTLAEMHTRANGELVAMMLPVVRTTEHSASYVAPVKDDEVTLWRHHEVVAGNGSYDIDPPSSSYVIGSSCGITWPSLSPPPANNAWRPYLDYVWLGLDPAQYPIAGGGVLLPANRWKALIKHTVAVDAGTGLLSGSLPTGPLGDEINIGGARDGAEVFQGELDELRVTALPILRVAVTDPATHAGWTDGSVDGAVQRWYWDTTSVPGWPLLRRDSGRAFDMADVRSVPPMPEGGYFMVDGQIYSYTEFDVPPPGTLFQLLNIKPVNDDLTPIASASGVIAGGHAALRELIPLNFLQTGSLQRDIADSTQMIRVNARFEEFPDSGFVKVDDEIFSYDTKQDEGGGRIRLTLNQAPVRRGCYGTTAAAHPADSIIRLLPVRYPDRYRAETTAGTWNVHTTNTTTAMASRMCMFSFSVNHAGRQLRKIWWRFKEPLEDNEKVAVLVMVDNSQLWTVNPDLSNTDEIWGKLCTSSDPQNDSLSLYTATGDRPTVDAQVEVRFYFDLSYTDPYNTTFAKDPTVVPGGGAPVANGGWSNMAELDTVGIEMVPEPITF